MPVNFDNWPIWASLTLNVIMIIPRLLPAIQLWIAGTQKNQQAATKAAEAERERLTREASDRARSEAAREATLQANIISSQDMLTKEIIALNGRLLTLQETTTHAIITHLGQIKAEADKQTGEIREVRRGLSRLNDEISISKMMLAAIMQKMDLPPMGDPRRLQDVFLREIENDE